MPPRSAAAPSVDRLLPPILSLLTSTPPNPYSAHQKALTTTARIAHSSPNVAVEILFNVSRELLKLGEAGSGAELGFRMLQIMGDSDAAVDEKSRASVTQLLALTPPAGPWRKKLADAAIKWSQSHGSCPTGDPALHQYIGELYYKDQLYVQAEAHLLASGKRDAASLLAQMMFEWCDKGSLDPGPYALRGVLPHLSHRPPDVQPAATFLTRFLSLLASPASACSKIFVSTLPSQTSFSPSDIQLTTSPTLNFLQLALITIQRAPAPGVSGVQARGLDGGIGKEWEALCGRYTRLSGANGVIGHKEVQEALAHIATEVFLIPARGGGQNDLLQNLMGSLFGGGGGR